MEPPLSWYITAIVNDMDFEMIFLKIRRDYNDQLQSACFDWDLWPEDMEPVY